MGTKAKVLLGKAKFNQLQLLLLAGALVAMGAVLILLTHAATNAPLVYWSMNFTPGVTPTSNLISVNPDGSQKTSLTPSTTASYRLMRYAPDRNHIAWFLTSPNPSGTVPPPPPVLQIFNIPTKQTVTVNFPNTGNSWIIANSLAWYPNSKKLVFGGGQNSTTSCTNGALYTVNVDGSGLAQVPNVSNCTRDLEVATDNSTIVYAGAGGNIVSVVPGQQPVGRFVGNNCSTVRRKPHVVNTFAYVCFKNSTASVYTHTFGTPPKLIYSQPGYSGAIGQTWYAIKGFDWAPSGNQLAVALNQYVTTASCQATEQRQVSTMNADGTGAQTLYSTAAGTQSCQGGGTLHNLAWSLDGSQIAFINDGTLLPISSVTLNVIPSTQVSTTTKVVDTGVGEVDW